MSEQKQATEQIKNVLEQTKQIKTPTELNAEDLDKVAGGITIPSGTTGTGQTQATSCCNGKHYTSIG